MFSNPYTEAARSWTTHTPAANTNAVATLAAISGGYNVIDQILFSYDATPAGSITITDGTTTIVLSIVDSGPGHVPFTDKFAGALGAAVTVTLAAGGAGVTGKVAVQHH